MNRLTTSVLTAIASACIVVLLFHFASAWNPTAAAQKTGLGMAAEFTLTSQEGSAFDLSETRGSVVALSFVFTRCTDICPIAGFKFSWMQEELGGDFGSKAFFVTVTVDPEHDKVQEMADYAALLDADTSGWAFLTGNPEKVRRVAEDYGVFVQAGEDGIEHILLTSLIDRHGEIRMQYLGEKFDEAEMLADIRDLIGEAENG